MESQIESCVSELMEIRMLLLSPDSQGKTSKEEIALLLHEAADLLLMLA